MVRRSVSVCIAALVICGLPSVAQQQVDGEVSPSEESVHRESFRDAFLKGRKIVKSKAENLRVRRIANRLISASDQPGYDYEFVVIRGKVHEFEALPGGTILVPDEGLKRFNDDELAFAIGHEIAHIALRHHLMQSRVGVVLESDDVGLLERAVPLNAKEAEALILKILSRQLGPPNELQADEYSILYMTRAGFAASAAHTVIVQTSPESPPEGSPHPPARKRLKEIRRKIKSIDDTIERFYKGVTFLEAGIPRKAIPHFHAFVQEFPQDAAGLVNLGSAYLSDARDGGGTPLGLAESLPILRGPVNDLRNGGFDPIAIEKAILYFDQARRLDDHTYEALAGLALAYARLGDADRAWKLLQRARREDGDATPGLAMCLGNVAYILGRYEEARQLYQEELRLHQTLGAVKNLAMTLEQLDDRSTACSLWSQLLLLGLVGDDDDLLDALECI